MAGILAVIRLRNAGYTNVVVYEKADRIGGTWRENTYPGLTCDVPSHSYTYSFEPNPEWSRFFPGGEEIYQYFYGVAQKYDVLSAIRFNQEVVSCVYEGGRWNIRTAQGLTDSADFVIAATGVLHHPSYPDIKGMDSFKGALFHSARWDHSVPLDGKRIGVIGSGSTGVQIICALAGRASNLKHFQRTAQWITHRDNGDFTEEEKHIFRTQPDVLRKKASDDLRSRGGAFSKAISDAQSEEIKMIEAAVLANLEERVKDPVLLEKLRPTYRAACKRIVMSPEYYEKIQHPDVELVVEKIEGIEPGGIRTDDGILHELDVIALATGFHAHQFMRPMNVIGRDGLELNDAWEKRPTAYLAVSMPDFPNMFLLNGPTGPVGNFSLIDIAEREMTYIIQLADRVSSGEYREISASKAALADYEERRIKQAKNTIFASGCKSWYLDAEGVPSTWPWPYEKFEEAMAAPDFDAYQMVA